MTGSERLSLLTDGADPLLIMRMKSGFAVLGDSQFLRGYSLLLAYPEVKSLNDLSHEGRVNFLHDMSLLGDAIQRATESARVNYGIYGNLDRYLHAHVTPRYTSETAPYNTVPPLSYPTEIREAPENQFDLSVHGRLIAVIRQHLYELVEHSHVSHHHGHRAHPFPLNSD